MAETLGIILTLLAVLFVRKQDIASFLHETESIHRMKDNVLFPEAIYRERIHKLELFLDKHLSSGILSFFPMFMISLLYTSFSFVVSLHFPQNDNILLAQKASNELTILAGLSFTLSAPIIYMIGRSGTRMIRPSCVRFSRSKVIIKRLNKLSNNIYANYWNFLAAATMSALSYVVYNDYLIAAFTTAICFLSAIYSMNFAHWIILSRRWITIFAGGTLGAWGLILVSFSFASADMTLISTLFGIGISLLSGIFAILGNLDPRSYTPHNHCDHPDLPLSSGKATITAMGRPSLFVAFYCGRCPGQYSAAISIILANIFWTQAYLPDAISCAGAVTLACFTFLAGATSLAGAGIFALAVVGIVAGYMLFQPHLLFTVWAPSFMLWILFPIVSSPLDWARWSIMRRNIHNFVKTGRSLNTNGFLIDFFTAVVCYYALIFSVFFILSAFNETCKMNGFPEYFKVDEYIGMLPTDALTHGLWLQLMAVVIFLPSFLQYALFLVSGYSSVFSKSTRRRIYNEALSASSAYERDSAAWKIAAVDILGRLIFAATIILATVYIASASLPLFEHLLVKVSTYAVEIGKRLFS